MRDRDPRNGILATFPLQPWAALKPLDDLLFDILTLWKITATIDRPALSLAEPSFLRYLAPASSPREYINVQTVVLLQTTSE